MPRKNRAYKKGEPFRDASLYVIVAEGKREDEYFRFFQGKTSRLRIKIVPREEGSSSPKQFLGRLQDFQQELGWSSKERDQTWFVLDVDRWPRIAIEELRQTCVQFSNWHIAISNPCFEVWLLFHLHKELEPVANISSKEVKGLLHQSVEGGYKVEEFAIDIKEACSNAEYADRKSKHYYPGLMITKVYKLGQAIIHLLGENWR
ncbi:MAG: RloB family protein [Bacteroidota bacterium]